LEKTSIPARKETTVPSKPDPNNSTAVADSNE
jgi:hypothetical protein